MAKHHPDLIMCMKQPGIGKRRRLLGCPRASRHLRPAGPRRDSRPAEQSSSRMKHRPAHRSHDRRLPVTQQTARCRSHRTPVREVRRQVPDLRLLRAASHPGEDLRRVQLWLLRGPLRHLRRHRRVRRLLLQGVHDTGKGRECSPPPALPPWRVLALCATGRAAACPTGTAAAAAAAVVACGVLLLRPAARASPRIAGRPRPDEACCCRCCRETAAPRSSTWARPRRTFSTSARSTALGSGSGCGRPGGWGGRGCHGSWLHCAIL
jgi:hypothetical protein